jgi:hypothetical protein
MYQLARFSLSWDSMGPPGLLATGSCCWVIWGFPSLNAAFPCWSCLSYFRERHHQPYICHNNINVNQLKVNKHMLQFKHLNTSMNEPMSKYFNSFIRKVSKCLKQHASRFMLIFMKILEMYLKVKYCVVDQ